MERDGDERRGLERLRGWVTREARGDADRRVGWAVLGGAALLCGGALVLGPTLAGAGSGAPAPPVEEPHPEVRTSVTLRESDSPHVDGSKVVVDEYLMRCSEYYEVTSATRTLECVPVEEDPPIE
ncbi:hypothetical protein [Agromyces mangrovi Wang et al. 2018]|uniref:hypothetical protein n=1 Tax=Agromyces mangrovi TaxID=1858653 RepID=UPI002573A2F8|nr:hypothetical protein [Agromyces mangrovi]BDZ63299.1 hypothetical protein GCM10025877_02370 [Agromyces mangrovi]